MELCLIWAQDEHGAIGREGVLPWHIAEDLRHFRDVTAGRPVIMGRKTWDSLPRKPLPGRQNIVVTRQSGAGMGPGVVAAGSLEDALLLAGATDPVRGFVIGGGQLFAEAIPLAQRLFITRVHSATDGADVFAPAYDPTQWLEVVSTPAIRTTSGVSCSFHELRRRSR